jgi:hypothetical protein
VDCIEVGDIDGVGRRAAALIWADLIEIGFSSADDAACGAILSGRPSIRCPAKQCKQYLERHGTQSWA